MGVPRLIGVVQESLESSLSAHGWRTIEKRGEYFRLIKIEFEHIVFALDPNPSTSMGGVSLNPSVGVRTERFARLHNKLFQLDGDVSMIGSTLATIVHHQCGIKAAPYTRWMIREIDDLVDVKSNFLNDLEEFGMPFLRSFSTPESIIRMLEAGPRGEPELGALAIAYADGGDVSRALAPLAEYLGIAERNSPGSLMAEYMLGFVRRFAEHFGVDLASLPTNP